MDNDIQGADGVEVAIERQGKNRRQQEHNEVDCFEIEYADIRVRLFRWLAPTVRERG